MGGGALETNGLTNGETENSLHRQFSPAHAALDNSLSHASDAVADHDVPAKRARLQKELTFQDMYQNEGVFDEDDEDDSDWEPFQLHKCVEFEIKKWCCRNCTMINLDCNDCCYICGEHRESKILSHGFFASPLAQDDDLIEVQGDIKGLKGFKNRDVCRKPKVLGSLVYEWNVYGKKKLIQAWVDKKSPPHPERPDRLQVIAASLSRAEVTLASLTNLIITILELKVHSLEHIESVEVTTESLSSYFTPDTYANQHSALAARLAAGLCADLASAIVSGRAKNGFALVRPPGHHAGVRQAMGFCLHNNAAVAALAAQAAGARKVLILDWDVHHGNGTQEIFEHNKSVLYISLHRHEDGKFYPGTGAAEEVLDCRRNFKLKLMLLANLASYNLRSISSSATAVIKVLLGESPGCELENSFPSKAGLLTVLEVLKIQMKFWLSLGPIFVNLESQWRMYCFQKKRKQIKKRRRLVVPMWWRWGRKSSLFYFMNGHLHKKSK
ncbi:Histone deacetylase [Vigna angularis]|uniref:histone deacetylase n=1 Tax=Phaseolus angularis TaxID=3914 RepID=A0A8T0L7D9_PHAAN|nr:Histone deacetylase [Vigna angularis]